MHLAELLADAGRLPFVRPERLAAPPRREQPGRLANQSLAC